MRPDGVPGKALGAGGGAHLRIGLLRRMIGGAAVLGAPVLGAAILGAAVLGAAALGAMGGPVGVTWAGTAEGRLESGRTVPDVPRTAGNERRDPPGGGRGAAARSPAR